MLLHRDGYLQRSRIYDADMNTSPRKISHTKLSMWDQVGSNLGVLMSCSGLSSSSGSYVEEVQERKHLQPWKDEHHPHKIQKNLKKNNSHELCRDSKHSQGDAGLRGTSSPQKVTLNHRAPCRRELEKQNQQKYAEENKNKKGSPKALSIVTDLEARDDHCDYSSNTPYRRTTVDLISPFNRNSPSSPISSLRMVSNEKSLDKEHMSEFDTRSDSCKSSKTKSWKVHINPGNEETTVQQVDYGQKYLTSDMKIKRNDKKHAHKQRKKVRFGTVSLREYALVLGGEGGKKVVCPLQLGWAHTPTTTYDLNDYEKQRKSNKNVLKPSNNSANSFLNTKNACLISTKQSLLETLSTGHNDLEQQRRRNDDMIRPRCRRLSVSERQQRIAQVQGVTVTALKFRIEQTPAVDKKDKCYSNRGRVSLTHMSFHIPQKKEILDIFTSNSITDKTCSTGNHSMSHRFCHGM